MTSISPSPLLHVSDLTKVYPQGGPVLPTWGRGTPSEVSPRHLKAVDGVSLEVAPGEAVGIVGESGSGKTTIARCLLRLIKPTSGAIVFNGQSVLDLSGPTLMAFRRQAQIVFQDPFASLDPHSSVRQAIAEPLRVHKVCPRSRMDARIEELLQSVGLDGSFMSRHRHELSGGEAQRVTIARALATSPNFLILDEPTSALDASARLRVISLLRKLRADLGMTYLVISHDLSIIRYLCNRVLVMYLGRVVEDAPVDQLFTSPQHPYTEALLSATPVTRAYTRVNRIRLRSRLDFAVPANGCPLAPRCHHATRECFTHPVSLVPISPVHATACRRVTEGEIILPDPGAVVPASQIGEESR